MNVEHHCYIAHAHAQSMVYVSVPLHRFSRSKKSIYAYEIFFLRLPHQRTRSHNSHSFRWRRLNLECRALRWYMGLSKHALCVFVSLIRCEKGTTKESTKSNRKWSERIEKNKTRENWRTNEKFVACTESIILNVPKTPEWRWVQLAWASVYANANYALT